MEIKINERPSSCTIKIGTSGKFSGELKEYSESSITAVMEAIESSKILENYINKKNNKGV